MAKKSNTLKNDSTKKGANVHPGQKASNWQIIQFLIDKGADMNANCDTILRKSANGEKL